MLNLELELEHPDYWKDEEGNCDHHWVHVGTNRHGSYYRCHRCGVEEEA